MHKASALTTTAANAYRDKNNGSGPREFSGIRFAKMMTGSTDAREIADRQRPNDLTPDFFDDPTRADLTLKSKMLLQADQIYQTLENSKNEETMKASAALDSGNKFSNSYGSSTLIESDSVLNQMLLQYEHAGQEACLLYTSRCV